MRMKTMKRKFFLKPVFLLLVFSLLLGCAALTKYGKFEKNARQHFKSGRYEKAVLDCVSSLKIKPEYDKAQALVQEAFATATNYHENKIKGLENSNQKFKWDNITSDYESLVKINQAVNELPVLTNKKTKKTITFRTKDYSDELTNAKNNAAEVHYQEGLRLSQLENINDQKQAAKEFKAASNFISQYKDSESLYEKSRLKGIKRLAIIPFEDTSGKRGRYGDISGMIVDEVVTKVLADPSAMEFLEIVSRDHLEKVMQEQRLSLTGLVDESTAVKLGNILGAHEILTGKITQIIYVPEKTIKKPSKMKKNVVVKKEKYKDPKGKSQTRDIRGDVSANVIVHSKTAGAKITGSYKIIDITTTKLIKSETFTNSHDFNYDWATFTGDERALNNTQKQLARKKEIRATVAGELINNACKNLSNSLTKTLIEYAK